MFEDKSNPLNYLSDEIILEQIEDELNFEKGFKNLMIKYQERIYWHIRRMTANHEDTNDIIQNTFIKVYKNIPKFEGKSKLYTWLFRIATNETLTFLKKKSKNMVQPIHNYVKTIDQQLSDQTFMTSDEIQKRFQNALDSLPDKQRTVFSLRYYEEMSYKEMSEVLKTSIGSLKASYHHAAKKVESLLKKSI